MGGACDTRRRHVTHDMQTLSLHHTFIVEATLQLCYQDITDGLVVGGGKHMIPSILEQILMLWHNIRHSAKEIKHFDEIWPSYLTFEIL